MSTEPIDLDDVRAELGYAHQGLIGGGPHLATAYSQAQALLREVERQAAELDRYHALHDWLAGEIENWKALPVERIQEQLAKVNGQSIRRQQPSAVGPVEFDEHRWYVRIRQTTTDGTVKEWVASADEGVTGGSGIWFGTRDEYNAAEVS